MRRLKRMWLFIANVALAISELHKCLTALREAYKAIVGDEEEQG
jgi:hypothetical protein